MTITWLGRACFKIVHDGYTIVIDPYTAASTGYPELHVNADMVLVSHNHRGHDNVSAVKLSGTNAALPLSPSTRWWWAMTRQTGTCAA
jgi:L-ascorbate metabolism protein UlaG (beta-lactamase superfamily)